MKLKLLPWLFVAVLVVVLGFLYGSNQKQESELAQLRQSNQEFEQRATLNETNSAPAQAPNDELTRLRAENQDVLRLRNEVRRLRDENQQLKTQAQSAQQQVQTVQAQAEQLRSSAAQASAQAQQLETIARAKAQADLTAACINNLRQLDGAKQQWALENNKPANSPVQVADVLPYLRAQFPTCPAGGVYTLNAINRPPTCSVPGHVLPKAP